MKEIKNIILTNSGDISSFNKLIDFGYNIHHFPMIEISHNDIKPFSLDDYDYYIFTSKNGVEAFFNFPFVKVQYEKKVTAICLGSKTANKIREFGVAPKLISSLNYTDGLLEQLIAYEAIKDKKTLLVQGNLAPDNLFSGLKSLCDISRVDAYQTSLHNSVNIDLQGILENEKSITVFTSPSSFESFSKLYDPIKTHIVTIGNTTSDFIKNKGFKPVITSKQQSFEAITEEIIRYFKLNNIQYDIS